MENISISVRTDREKKHQGNLFGIFFEDINHSADGGLYGELVRNRSFEFEPADGEGYHSLLGWEAVERGKGAVYAHVETTNPLNSQNLHYLVLEVVSKGDIAGIRNEGYAGGISLKKGNEYHFSCYARRRRERDVRVEIRLENAAGDKCYGKEVFLPGLKEWEKFECTLVSSETDNNARLVLGARDNIRVELDMISLFPKDTFLKRRNGMRKDIGEMLADMNPRFMRFPGGCLAHLGSLDAKDRCSMYRWKNTVEPVEERPSRQCLWKYNQSLGLGFYEFFQFCEDIGTEPLPVIAAGYDPHSLRAAEPEEMQEWIDEALDLIEFANGSRDTYWGGVRAQMGHPESFHLKYLGIGNEEVGDEFFDRYEMILDAVKNKYPEIQVIGSAGPASSGSEFVKGWNQARRTKTDYVDEHFYQSPEWMIANADRYERYAPEPKAFLGEYASRGDCWKNALGEAVFMTGMEKAQGIGLACYAPMLCHVNYSNWYPNMIYFDNSRVYGSPSYYVQKLFMKYQGEFLLETSDNILVKEKEKPLLLGKAAFRTKQADVCISEIVIEDSTAGKVQKFPEGRLSVNNRELILDNIETSCYTISFRFSKKSGSRRENLEGQHSFSLDFAGKDGENYLSWVFDGWEQMTGVQGYYKGEYCEMGLYLFETETDREYEARLHVEENHIAAYIDGICVCEHYCKSPEPESLYYSAVKDEEGQVIVKIVNAEASPKHVNIRLEGGAFDNRVSVSKMSGFQPEDKNSFEEPEKVSPREEIEMLQNEMYSGKVEGESLTVLRFRGL